MQFLTRTAILIAALMVACLSAQAHPPAPQSKESNLSSSSVSGRVTADGNPAANVTVILMPFEGGPQLDRSVARSTTDVEGRFQMTNVPAGRFSILALAPAFAAEGDAQPYLPGHSITLANGETVSGINIALRRGGVITGRVTDASGHPRIQERVTLSRLDENGRKQNHYSTNYFMFLTDDRGVYRVYGLPAGRYLVSAGIETGRNFARMGQGNTYYARTFHPGTTDESKATVVEIAAGGEATGIDIPLGRPEKSYTVSGRIVDADTGKPAANLIYGYGSMQPDGKSVMSMAYGARSGEDGEFHIEGVMPGRYAALVRAEDAGLYGDPAPFQIMDADVKNVEIKIHRGSSINGVVVVEGASDQEIGAKLADLQLGTSILSDQVRMGPSSFIKVNGDGSFRATGLRPGKVRFFLAGYPSAKGFSFLRLERNGVEQPEGIDIGVGESISGVKLVFAYGTGVIRGQLKIEGMDWPEGAWQFVNARRAGDTNPDHPNTQVDSRGRFMLEGLPPGEYELIVDNSFVRVPNSQPIRVKRATQTVTVANGAEVEVIIRLERETQN